MVASGSNVIANSNVTIGVVHNTSLRNRETSNSIITESYLTEIKGQIADNRDEHASSYNVASSRDLASSGRSAHKRSMRASILKSKSTSVT